MSSSSAHGRLAVLSAHLAAAVGLTDNETAMIEPSCVSSQSMVQPPGNLSGALTVVDERTGKKYQISVTEDGTVKASDFKKVCLSLLP